MKEIHNFFLSLIALVITVTLVIFSIHIMVEKETANLNYCIDNRWDRITTNIGKLVCYKEIKDLSGMGFYYTYSEEIE